MNNKAIKDRSRVSLCIITSKTTTCSSNCRDSKDIQAIRRKQRVLFTYLEEILILDLIRIGCSSLGRNTNIKTICLKVFNASLMTCIRIGSCIQNLGEDENYYLKFKIA